MAYNIKSMDNRRKARRNLERLIAEVEALPVPQSLEMQAFSGVGKASEHYMTLENAAEVHIYSEGPERWYADVVFKNVPNGFASVIGTPTKMPVKSQHEANEFAKHLIMSLRYAKTETTPPEDVAFEFDETTLSIPVKLYQEMAEKQREMEQSFPDEYIVDLMDRARSAIGGTITPERMEAASFDDRLKVIVAATICSLSGRLRWPDLVYDEEEDRDAKSFFQDDEMSEEELKQRFPWRS